MNNDVLTEILLHLPVQSLLRFRAVCRSSADVIDSSYFRELHTHNNRSDDTVCLEVSLSDDGILVQHNTKSLISRNSEGLGLTSCESYSRVLLYGSVKGLISISLGRHFCSQLSVPIVICNPFLGELKLLPLITTPSCTLSLQSVAIGFDGDYKVVQLSLCKMHNCLHAYVYSRSTDSWRELAFDNDLSLVSPIKSRCENGHFAHWKMSRMVGRDIRLKILSLDMNNEVFKTIMLPEDEFDYFDSPIFAKDEHLFWRFDFPHSQPHKLVRIYESRCEGSELSWNYMTSVEVPCSGFGIIPRWRTSFVVIEHEQRAVAFVYDYRAHKFDCKVPMGSLIAYKGSFVSL
ncbi:hypothetical protein AAHA92_03524 [Salvia divinorum]|uniref:F-box domain-containing protein n=1 Tax=Salvia divinorum TaxID=28513 RepID=A0ABD1IHC5_SALDI